MAMHEMMKMRGSLIALCPQDDMILSNTQDNDDGTENGRNMRQFGTEWHWRTWQLIRNQTWVGRGKVKEEAEGVPEECEQEIVLAGSCFCNFPPEMISVYHLIGR